MRVVQKFEKTFADTEDSHRHNTFTKCLACTWLMTLGEFSQCMKAQVDLTVCCLPSRVHELILSFAGIKDSSTRKVRDTPFSQLGRKQKSATFQN